jgi:restriction system protein
MGINIGSALVQAARAAERERGRQAREAVRAQKAHMRAQAADAKERRRLYLDARAADVHSKNAELSLAFSRLEELLIGCLHLDPRVDLADLLVTPQYPRLQLGELAFEQMPLPREHFFPKPLHPLIAWLGWARNVHARKCAVAETAFADHMQDHQREQEARKIKIDKLRMEHARRVKAIRTEAEAHNSEVRKWEQSFKNGEPVAIETYFTTVLTKSPYSAAFPHDVACRYLPESKQLVVEYGLPEMEAVIPRIKKFKYARASDSVTDTVHPEAHRRSRYASVVAQVIIRTLHEICRADSMNHVDTIVLSGYVDSIDRSTGQRVRPCVVSVRTTKDAFLPLDLRHVNALDCLRMLSACVSRSPSELVPVRPILDLNMCDSRFVQESDVLSSLDRRRNLMDLSWGDFESLITNLFQKMGLNTKLTQASRDGGVDCVAFDPRPVLGGKVVIQAKRYKNTVGVTCVRDLYGTMMNEGASKGILITTSGYGQAAFEFANEKPLELLSGRHLLHLLKEHAGVDAKIEMPDKWDGQR